MNKTLSLTLLVAALCALMATALLQHRRLSHMESRVEDLRWGALPLDIKRTMAWKQRYFDKAWHAGNAQDWEAARWYLRQVERMAEGIAQADLDTAMDYGPISTLQKQMFLPQFSGLYRVVDAGDRVAFARAYRDTVQSCNACHAATRHAYVRIAVPGEGVGGWNQRFEPSGAAVRHTPSAAAPALAPAPTAASPDPKRLVKP